MKRKKTIEETFTKIPDTILASDKLSPSQKLLISYVLRWQSSGMVCFESNNSLAKRFGLSLSAIKKQITQLNKLPFFLSKETSHRNEYGKWSNSKKMEVDEDKLKRFIEQPQQALPNQEKEYLYDNFDEFVAFVKELTNGNAPEDFIKFCYDEMPVSEMLRTKEFIEQAFQRYLPRPSSPPG